MTKHKYDDPLILPKEFLLAVMRDETVAIGLRIEAARIVWPLLEPGDVPGPYTGITYQIPPLPVLQ